MLALKEKLMEDLKLSMKDKDTVRKNTVQSVRAAIKQVEVDNRVELSDDDIIGVIAKEVKKRKDVLPEYADLSFHSSYTKEPAADVHART